MTAPRESRPPRLVRWQQRLGDWLWFGVLTRDLYLPQAPSPLQSLAHLLADLRCAGRSLNSPDGKE